MRYCATVLALALYTVTAMSQDPPCSRTYTLDADFDEGILYRVNHNAPNGDQLQMDPPKADTKLFPYIWVACSDRNTVVRIDVNTGAVLGEYRSMPVGRYGNPSRTTVDLDGNVWVSNRNETSFLDNFPQGSVVKIGLVIGGTRVDKNGNPDPNGAYLKPPFTYSTAIDRDGDGLIHTSIGLGDTLAWPNFTDGDGGPRALVEDAEDECILLYQRLPNAPNPRHCSVDNDNNVWVGGYPNTSSPLKRYYFHKLDNSTGAILRTINVGGLLPNNDAGPGGYGGLIDRNGVIWSTNPRASSLMKYDTRNDTGTVVEISGAYGIAMDPATDDIWVSGTIDNISLLHPDGSRYDGFPVATDGRTPKGVVVTDDGDVWVANNTSGTVSRLDRAGNVRTVIDVDSLPTGVAVDANGMIWVTNYASDNVMRIDPDGGFNFLGGVDMTIDLGEGSGPYNYSDMTGAHSVQITDWAGAWTITQQSCNPDNRWGTISWTADVPAGTSLTVTARGSDDNDWTDITALNGVNLCTRQEVMYGDSIEVRVAFAGDTVTGQSPVLYDLTIEQCPKTGSVSCGVGGDDNITVDNYRYDPEPFTVMYEVYNTGTVDVDTAQVFMYPPTYITTTEPLTKPISQLDIGDVARFSWPVTAETSPYDRVATIVFETRDIAGQLLNTCDHYVFLPGVDGLECNFTGPETLVWDEALNNYNPNPFAASLEVVNHLDTALTNVEVEIVFSSPKVAVEGGSTTFQLGTMNADDSFDFVWQLIASFVDTQEDVNVTAIIRCDQYPEGRECSFDVTIPPRRLTYCADCEQRGVDTVWINATNEIIMPTPFQAAVRISNPCSGVLHNVRCKVTGVYGGALADGEVEEKSIPSLLPNQSVFLHWFVNAEIELSDIEMYVEVLITADELPSEQFCVQYTNLIHVAQIPPTVSHKLMYFEGVQNGSVPPAQDITVYGGYPAQIPWTLQYPTWLDVQPETGGTVETVNVQPNTTALPPGRYTANIDLVSGAANSPERIDVIYDLLPTTGATDVPVAPEDIAILGTYPNPFSGALTVNFTTGASQNVTVRLFSMLGVEVQSREIRASAGRNSATITGLQSGLYMLVLSGRNGAVSSMVAGR